MGRGLSLAYHAAAYRRAHELSQTGIEIYNLRNTQLKLLNEHIKILNENNNYNFSVNLSIKDSFFKKDLSKDYYISKLKLNREYDKNFGGSKIGPHKSDIIAKINNNFDASQLSTGQQKTVVLMMLIAQCDNLINTKKIKPILLLDEICSHLDSNNRKIILDIINKFDVQLFLTGTDKTLFSFISKNVKFYNIEEL